MIIINTTLAPEPELYEEEDDEGVALYLFIELIDCLVCNVTFSNQMTHVSKIMVLGCVCDDEDHHHQWEKLINYASNLPAQISIIFHLYIYYSKNNLHYYNRYIYITHFKSRNLYNLILISMFCVGSMFQRSILYITYTYRDNWINFHNKSTNRRFILPPKNYFLFLVHFSFSPFWELIVS